MKKLLYTIDTNLKDKPQLKYYVTKNVIFDVNIYGIEICTQQETDAIYNLFADYEACINFISLLAKNHVYPTHLWDIAEDFIGR